MIEFCVVWMSTTGAIFRLLVVVSVHLFKGECAQKKFHRLGVEGVLSDSLLRVPPDIISVSGCLRERKRQRTGGERPTRGTVDLKGIRRTTVRIETLYIHYKKIYVKLKERSNKQ